MTLSVCPSARVCDTGLDAQANVAAIIVASGSGTRFGSPRGKQFVELCGLPLLAWALMAFDHAPSVGCMVVTCPRGRAAETATLVHARIRLATPCSFVDGGATRQESVALGLAAAADAACHLVAVHDGARPLVSVDTIESVIAAVRADATLAGALAAAPVTDTLKVVEDQTVIATPDRALYWSAFTPQAFRFDALREAHAAAVADGYVGTDDASLVERNGGRVRCVATARDNLKVTVPEDLVVAEAILRARLAAEGGFSHCDEG